MDPYKTLKIQPDAFKSEIKNAFRQLALKIVMSNLRSRESKESQMFEAYEDHQAMDETMAGGMENPEWELWEEWMDWEGAGIRDYSSHINPYI